MTFQQAIQMQINNSRDMYKRHGWEFKERTFDTHNLGDFVSAVLIVNTEADANEFYRGYIDWLEARTDRTHPAKYVADANIGWCFGEGMSDEKQAIWKKCTTASHPIFGRSNPTPQEAFDAGEKAGKRALSR